MRVVLAAGGTGGHVYPAISLADALMADNDTNRILFVGTADHIEATETAKAGYDFKPIDATGLAGSLSMQVRSILLMVKAINVAKGILSDFQADVVIGFGGYVSAPVIIAAAKLKIPVLLHEQNAYAGRANLFLERYADAVVVCYPSALKQFSRRPVYLYGNPRIYQIEKDRQRDVLNDYGLNRHAPIVLFVMGSQGSSSVNTIMTSTLTKLRNKPYQVVYVTGPAHYEAFRAQMPSADNIHILPYVQQTALLRDTALIITRGGATTATEICAVGVCSIIIPSPYVPNNHQELNAQALVDRGAALMIRESELDPDQLISAIDRLIADPDQRQRMGAMAKQLSRPAAAADIIKLMRKVSASRDPE